MRTKGYTVTNADGISNLGKASQSRVRAALQDVLTSITNAQVQINVIRADIANAREREERYSNALNQAKDSRIKSNTAAVEEQAASHNGSKKSVFESSTFA